MPSQIVFSMCCIINAQNAERSFEDMGKLDLELMSNLYAFGGLTVYEVSYFDPVQFRVVSVKKTFNAVEAKETAEKWKKDFQVAISSYLVKFDGAFQKKENTSMNGLKKEMLDFPRTVKDLSEFSGCSPARVRSWLKTFGNSLAIGFTRPRKYWLPSEEEARSRAEFRDALRTVAARNKMGV